MRIEAADHIEAQERRIAELESQIAAQAGKGIAYCKPCNDVGMSNCGNFDECGEPRCVTCNQLLSAPPAPANAIDAEVWHMSAARKFCKSFPESYFESNEPVSRTTLAQAIDYLDYALTEMSRDSVRLDYVMTDKYLTPPHKEYHGYLSGRSAIDAAMKAAK